MTRAMMPLSEIATLLNAQMIGADVHFERVGSDSRNIAAGQLFVAIKGEHFDGNQFAAQALAQGAVAALISDAAQAGKLASGLLVRDTRVALGLLAQYWRKKFAMPLVAITGSNGKTTVKEMLAAILTTHVGSADGVLATAGNLNNDIGMPMTLLKLRVHHQYAVIEMGMNHTGEIDYLTRLAMPNVALVNNAGTAHIGELGSQQAIAAAKGEIFAGLGNDGVAIINADDAYADYWRGLNAGRAILTFGLTVSADVRATTTPISGGQHMVLHTPQGEVAFDLALMGVHNARNALAASAAAIALNVPLSTIAQGLQSFNGVQGRLSRKAGLHGAVVIDDTYNANPDSMRAAMDVLASQAGKKIMVMGDMGELGDDAPALHAALGSYAKQAGVEAFYTLGSLSQAAAKAFGINAQRFTEVEALVESLKPNMQQGTTVLVKGSRFMKMERVVNAIVEHLTHGEAH